MSCRFTALAAGRSRQGCTEGKHPGGGSKRWNLLSVICYLLSVCLGRRQTELYRRQTPWRRRPRRESVICHLLSVICLLREEIDRAVQKTNTLEAAVNDEICYLSSDICYLLSVCLGRRQTELYGRQTTWRRQPTMKSVICHLISVIC